MTSSYTLGRSDAETQRLIKQASLYNAITERMLEDAGICPGMRVLDVGTGAGDVALLAAMRVGPTGSVTAIDSNPSILATARERALTAGLSNVTFLEGDCRSLALADQFDAAVGRLVLMYTAAPGEALKSIADHVRPGGVIAFQEWDLAPVLGYSAAGSPYAHQLWTWASMVFERTGAHAYMGAELYTAFQEAGLGEPRLALQAEMGGDANWSGYSFVADSCRILLPAMEKFGIATADQVNVDDVANRIRAEVVRTGRPFMLAPFVVAMARKPESRG